MQSLFSRVDYLQVGLTSKNSFKLIRKSNESIDVAIGDHSGSLQLFTLQSDSNQVETIFKTLPGPNAKINCIEVFSSQNSAKILTAYGSSTIKGFNRKGKQFFTLELNNLTEPIKIFKVRWPDEIFVVGQFIYNSYLINTESISANSHFSLPTSANKNTYNTVVKSRHYFVCPEKINDFILLEDKFNRKIVPILACQDRLLRVLKDSTCNFEVEVCGIPSVLQLVPKLHEKSKQNEVHICYGTLDGKIAMVTFQFSAKNQLDPIHAWEVPLNSIKQPISCLCFSEMKPEIYAGRSDGSIEIWKLNETIDEDNVQSVDLAIPPTMVDSYNCGESITNIIPVINTENSSLALFCSTFTGIIFGLTQQGHPHMRQLNPNYLIISKENAAKIEELKAECEKLATKLDSQQKKYELQSVPDLATSLEIEPNLSILPFFAINDTFVLHNDASYVLMLEVEMAIDVVILHCDISLDLIDCERNSAVISFNEPGEANPSEILVTFRCQANTTRLEIRLRPVEGQHGLLSVHVISRITPKSCLTRSYEIRPLSLHKRQYSSTHIEHPNTLTITGDFSINDGHTWLRQCIPEIPEKLSLTQPDVESEIYYYVSTMTKSILICNCGKGTISLRSDNVSTISILKDYITREATRLSVQIEIKVETIDKSLAVILGHVYPKIKSLIREKQRQNLYDAISDLQTSDADIATELFKDLRINSENVKLNENEGSKQDVMLSLDRIYGIITDLFIDYHKLKGSSISSLVAMAKQKLAEMATLIDSIVADTIDSPLATQESNDMDQFVEKLFQFWNVTK